MRLAVVGSVKLTEHQSELAGVIINGFINHYEPDCIISGGAVGVDSIAESHSNWNGIYFIKHLPASPQWFNGYKERNLKIAGDCTHLLCIRSEQSTTYGSGWTADRAEEMGKTVWRVKI